MEVQLYGMWTIFIMCFITGYTPSFPTWCWCLSSFSWLSSGVVLIESCPVFLLISPILLSVARLVSFWLRKPFSSLTWMFSFALCALNASCFHLPPSPQLPPCCAVPLNYCFLCLECSVPPCPSEFGSSILCTGKLFTTPCARSAFSMCSRTPCSSAALSTYCT